MNTLDRLKRRLEQAGIPPDLNRKWEALTAELSAYPSVVVAYSGGVDSSFLAYAASHVLGERMLAATVDSPLEAPEALESALDFAARCGIPHVALPFDPLQNPAIRSNPPERCYFCKSDMLRLIWAFSRQRGCSVVLEGKNADDRDDDRPGSRAIVETGARSPLASHGFTKADIRRLAEALGLSTWDKPSGPCLATRIPYGTPVTEQALRQVAAAERYLHQAGFSVVRVRHHGELARVEVDPQQMQQLIALRIELVDHFQRIGYTYVALDLQGYRSGSMNERPA